MSERGKHTFIPPDIRGLQAQLRRARQAYRELHGNGYSLARREAVKAECKRLYDILEAMKCR